MTPVPNCILGDPAYPLTPFCMKELDICSSNAEVVFNDLLCSTRNPVECASGRLKTRSSMLTKKIDLKLGHIPRDIYACLVLHNFCDYYNTYLDEDLIKLQIGVAVLYSSTVDEKGMFKRLIQIRNLPGH